MRFIRYSFLLILVSRSRVSTTATRQCIPPAFTCLQMHIDDLQRNFAHRTLSLNGCILLYYHKKSVSSSWNRRLCLSANPSIECSNIWTSEFSTTTTKHCSELSKYTIRVTVSICFSLLNRSFLENMILFSMDLMSLKMSHFSYALPKIISLNAWCAAAHWFDQSVIQPFFSIGLFVCDDAETEIYTSKKSTVTKKYVKELMKQAKDSLDSPYKCCCFINMKTNETRTKKKIKMNQAKDKSQNEWIAIASHRIRRSSFISFHTFHYMILYYIILFFLHFSI